MEVIWMSRCIIIGAGPGGMSAALYLKKAGLDVTIIDNMPGGELLNIDKIDNYLGFNSISGFDLAVNMLNQLKENNVEIVKDIVLSVIYDDGFKVKLKSSIIEGDYVILASGKERKKLGIEGEDYLVGRGVSYCAVCDGAFYKDKNVCVVGGGDSAFSSALYLSNMCEKVYVLVRGDVKASDDLCNKVLKKDNVIVMKNKIISKFNFDDVLENVLLNDGNVLDVSGVFVSIGGTPRTDILNKLGVRLSNGYVVCDENMESSFKNLYAVGDVRCKEFCQVSLAVSDGIIAALSIGKKE